MATKGLLEEVKAVLQQYQEGLSPGIYVFTPEFRLGKMTGVIIEKRSDHPDDASAAERGVTFGFYPLGVVPASLAGAPPSWLSGYPYLSGMGKLAEAPGTFLECLKRHVEGRMVGKKKWNLQPVDQWPAEDWTAAPED